MKAQEIKIVERYGDWKPPVNLRKTIEWLVLQVPHQYLAGLGGIVLARAETMPRSRRRQKSRWRKKKFPIQRALGLYHEEWDGQPACVELFVDNICAEYPYLALRIKPFREYYVGGILIHEIGHHIHKVHKPEYREREDVADEWCDKLLYPRLRRRYWYLMPFVGLLELIGRISEFINPSRKIGRSAS